MLVGVPPSWEPLVYCNAENACVNCLSVKKYLLLERDFFGGPQNFAADHVDRKSLTKILLYIFWTHFFHAEQFKDSGDLFLT